MPYKIRISDHLILPFGTAQKRDLSNIKLSSVGANGIYFTTDIPCVYINRNEKNPLRLRHFRHLFSHEVAPHPEECATDVVAGLDFINGLLQQSMPEATPSAIRFLQLYFDWIKMSLEPGSLIPLSDSPNSVYDAMLPIPEMQIYVDDPLQPGRSFEPKNNFRVDFGFWTGSQLVAIEIDGHEPMGYSSDVRRDRLLRRANVDVIHILNSEINQHGLRVVTELLPEEIIFGWTEMKWKSSPFR
jgi:hypothetical protein